MKPWGLKKTFGKPQKQQEVGIHRNSHQQLEFTSLPTVFGILINVIPLSLGKYG